MTKMTMQQEVELLRKEVALLKSRQKEAKSPGDEGSEKKSLTHDGEIASSLKERAGQIEDDIKDQLNDVVTTLKKDYETISPVSALILFAIGAAFGRILSSK